MARSSTAVSGGFSWERLPGERLLDSRLCDLGLRIEGTALETRAAELQRELIAAGLAFAPAVWLSEEWFSPDGVNGFAAPFYLAHPRLARLERAQMLECEGASRRECLKIMRHEAGHALDNAFGLHRRRAWREAFGRFSAPYPPHYQPMPSSRNYVIHLNAWYAQAHPAEDFAETFAVWLADPRQRWRRVYDGWPALAKLEAVDRMMQSLRGQAAPNDNRCPVEPLAECCVTLREHYERKRQFYQVGLPSEFDSDLVRIFARASDNSRSGRESAAAFINRILRPLTHAVAQATGVHHYVVSQLMRRIRDRARHLRLVRDRSEELARDELAAFLTAMVVYVIQHGHPRIPL
jgi:hypothetical protein